MLDFGSYVSSCSNFFLKILQLLWVCIGCMCNIIYKQIYQLITMIGISGFAEELENTYSWFSRYHTFLKVYWSWCLFQRRFSREAILCMATLFSCTYAYNMMSYCLQREGSKRNWKMWRVLFQLSLPRLISYFSFIHLLEEITKYYTSTATREELGLPLDERKDDNICFMSTLAH